MKTKYWYAFLLTTVVALSAFTIAAASPLDHTALKGEGNSLLGLRSEKPVTVSNLLAEAKSPSLPSATVTAGNGIYKVYVEDSVSSGKGVGIYTATTGPLHPAGNGLNVLFGNGNPGTTFNTIRSYTSGTDYVQIPGKSSGNLVIFLNPYGTVTPIGTIGFRTTYVLPGPPTTPDKLTIISDVKVNGTTFQDSTIEVTTTVINNGAGTVSIGIRYLWDYQIGADDGPTFQEVNPNGIVRTNEAQLVAPRFESYQITDNDRNPPTFFIFGTVTGPATVVPTPTPPDLLQYASWSGASPTAFDYAVNPALNISLADSAVQYFFGHNSANAITIQPGATNTVSASLFLAPSTLKVIKHVVNDNGGTAIASDFTMSVTGNSPSPATFPGDESGTTVALNAGAYSINETGPTGYTSSFSADCSGSIALGETKTCTITNDDIPKSQLIVIKHVVNDNGGTAVASDFTMSVTGINPSPASFSGAEAPGTTVTIDPGNYSVSETGPGGYTSSFSADCSGSIGAGQTKRCIVTNDDQQASITVTKVVTNDNGGSAVPDDFNLTLEGNPVLSGIAVPINPGTYTVGETLLSGYIFEGFSGDCDSNGDVIVTLGENKTCTLTNNDQPRADLSITKTDSPDPVSISSDLTYTLTVTNNGPDKATGVSVTDTLPVGVTPVSATPSPGTCILGAVVTCDIGDLDPGASATVTIEFTVDSTVICGSTLTNRAVVTGNESDPDVNNNTVSTDTMVNCPPQTCTILDDFNRPDGPLGSNWDGRTNGYRIVNNEVAVRRGGPIYWQPDSYGADQEACVTLTRINPKSRQHALLLKVQELNNWRQGAIMVSYNARSGNIDVEARDVINKKWILVGSFTMAVVDGDQLRAQALADGTVEVFVNNISIGTADAGSFYADKGGQIGLWFLGRQADDKDNGDKDNDRESLIQARERNSNGDDEHEGDDDDDSSAARRALLDDFGGGTIITTPPLTQISSDPFTNTTSQHKTEVEPDSFSNGSTIVSVQQSGRFAEGGASNICWSTLNNATLVANGCLPGITKFASPPGIFDRVSDPAVAFDAKHGVWLVSTLAVTETPSVFGKAVLSSRSTDPTATAWNNPVTVSEATGNSRYDKNWIACDNTPASPFYGNCYTEWDDAGLGAMLLMSTSSDGGLTWGPKKIVGTGATGLGGQPVVQPNGTVIVPYINSLNATQILAFLSTDGGVSWGNPFVVSNVSFHNDAGGLRAFAVPSAEIDGDGKVYLVWPDCRFRIGCTSNDIVMSTSTDGMSWTTVTRVPIGTTTDGADNFIPGIAVDKTTSGATAKVAITYYYYPVASCTFATCQLNVGFVSSPDGGANWTSAAQLAGPMTLSWLPDTSLGRMVGDYISTSYGSDGLAQGFFAVAKAPTGDPDCAIATPNCDQAIYTTSSGLALSATSNAAEILIAAEVGTPQPPIPLNTDEYVPDPSNFTR